LAETKTVTLQVPGMDCSACPITVRTALKKVPGVGNVSVTYEPKEAVVTFDDKKTSLAALQEATKNAGYPSVPKRADAGAR
jgi:mercuric ion binding protein